MAWFEACLLLTTCVAMFAQCFAIWLILNKSPVAMHAYRFFLVTNSASDLLFAFILGCLLQPDLLFPAPALIVQGLARFFGPYGGIIAFSLAVIAGTCQIHFQNWSLLYRWSVVQERFPRLSEFLTTARVRLFIAVHGQLIGAAIGFGSSTIFVAPEVTPAKLWHHHNISLEDGGRGQVFLLANLANGLADMPAVCPIIGIGLLICASFWCYISVAIIRLFRANSHVFSTRTYQLHMQLNVLLILQLVSPIVLIILPVTLGILGLIAHAEYGKVAGQFGVLMFAFYALGNPLLTIFFLAPYRRFTLRITRLDRLSMIWSRNGKVQPKKPELVWSTEQLIGSGTL